MVNDRLAITGAVWPSSAVTAAAKRRLGLVALPRGVAVSNVEDAEGDGGTRTMTTVTFAAWKLQTEGIFSPPDPYR
jgi:ribosomal protein L2